MCSSVVKTVMKLADKKSTNCKQTTTLSNRTPTERPIFKSSKICQLFRPRPELNLLTITANSRIEEMEKLGVEAELRRDEGRIYAAFFSPR